MPVRLLPGERLEAQLSPHALAWLGRYLLAGFPAILAIALALMFRTAWWNGAEAGKWYQVWTFLYGNAAAAYIYMFAALAVVGAVVAVAAIRWRTFFLYIAIGGLATAATIMLEARAEAGLPVALAVFSAPLLWWAEMDRRSHRYILTNLRILFQGGVVVRKERQLKYEAITDLDGSQGLLGRILDYGTLIPVTQSGFGLGSDTSQAGVAIGGGAQRGGVMGGGAVFAGGGKEVQTGRARTFHQLTGVRPYEETKYLLERLVQEATTTPYLREQVELQRQMVAHMARMQPQGEVAEPEWAEPA